MIKACIFDLDGTLLDTVESIRYYLNSTLERYSVPGIDSEKTKVFVGRGAYNLVKTALADAGVDIGCERGAQLAAKICREYTEFYDTDPGYLTVPYDGIPEAIAALYSAGIKLAVLSNKPDRTVRELVEMNFADKFVIVQGAREGIALKPDPAAAEQICRELGVSADEVAYFGDTGTDMQTGKNFGAGYNVGVLWGFRSREELVASGAQYTLSHPEKIVPLVLGD